LRAGILDIRDPTFDATPLGCALHDCLVEKRHPEAEFARVVKASMEAGSPLKDVRFPTGPRGGRRGPAPIYIWTVGCAGIWLAGGPGRSRVNLQKMLKWSDVLNLARNGNPVPARKIVKQEAEWRRQLTDEQYRVTRQADTERAFSSEMCSLFEPGLYSCVCCDTLLFDSNEKFESHTGWPSFTQPIEATVIAYHFDGPAILQRVEAICNTCDAHLGHVFSDGPEPSGLRYCMNAVALTKAART
jgi:peptide-methionine (R)-S-oxide reductase